MQCDNPILPTAYLGPVDWYRAYLQDPQAVRIEVMESFPKQTYRNRCTITTPDGPLTLSVPVKKSEHKQLTRDVEISYQTRWQHQHWISLVSAYRRTPYFDYFEDYFRPFYERETKYLVDLNNGLHEVIMQLLNRSMTPLAGYTLQPTTDWMGRNLEPCFGSGRSILDELFETAEPPLTPDLRSSMMPIGHQSEIRNKTVFPSPSEEGNRREIES